MCGFGAQPIAGAAQLATFRPRYLLRPLEHSTLRPKARVREERDPGVQGRADGTGAVPCRLPILLSLNPHQRQHCGAPSSRHGIVFAERPAGGAGPGAASGIRRPAATVDAELPPDELAEAVQPLVAQVAQRLAERARRAAGGGAGEAAPGPTPAPAAVAAAALASAEGSGALPPLSRGQRAALAAALTRAAEDLHGQIQGFYDGKRRGRRPGGLHRERAARFSMDCLPACLPACRACPQARVTPPLPSRPSPPCPAAQRASPARVRTGWWST